MIAYFDTAIFDQLYRKVGCTAADVAGLRKAIYGRALSIPLSIHHLEEIVLERRNTPQALSAQIRQALSIASLRSLVKPCLSLLLDDIRAFAARGEADSPFIHGAKQNAVSSGIAELIESDGEEIGEEFVDALEEAHRQRVRFLAEISALREDAVPESPAAGAAPSFAELWNAQAASVARALADRAGVLEQCEERGIEQLLDLRAVRAAVTVVLSGDSSGGDLALPPATHHLLSAAARAATFVTADARLRVMAERARLAGFVALDLPTFLRSALG